MEHSSETTSPAPGSPPGHGTWERGASHVVQENAIAQYVRILEPRTVLEPGIGDGRISRCLLPVVDSIDEYHGFDLVDPPPIEGVQAWKADWFGAGITLRYDLVLEVDVLMHHPPKSAYQMVQRALKWVAPGGTFMSVGWHADPYEFGLVSADGLCYNHFLRHLGLETAGTVPIPSIQQEIRFLRKE